MPDNYLGKAHVYFSLSDYEIDPHSRYRKRIFHEGPSSWTTQAQRPSKTGNLTVPKLEVSHAKENTQTKEPRKRRREGSVDGYVTDGSYAEAPPKSPYSSSASIYGGIDDIDDESDSPSVSDCERSSPSTPGRRDPKGKKPACPANVPISTCTLPTMSVTSEKLSGSSSAPSSITQYSNNRLAERARLASMPHDAAVAANNAHPKTSTSNSSKVHLDRTGREAGQTVQQADQYLTIQSAEARTDSSLAIRARRATISGAAVDSGSSLEAKGARQKSAGERTSAKNELIDESGRGVTPEKDKVKVERATPPPPLDLNAPEQPYSATQSARMSGPSASAGLDPESTRRRKRSKSTPYSAVGSEPFNPIEAEPAQSRKRNERGPSSQTFRRALDSGDYVQISDNGWICRVHGDHLGGPRSVTRHHESVHLNIVVQCEYCNAQFSRRDAVLRHQRQSSCRTNGNWKA